LTDDLPNTPQEMIEDIRTELINIRQIKDKKANLFLKEIVMLAGKDIFQDFSPEKYENFLCVPIDKVIRKVYWRLSSSKSFPEHYTKQHDREINALAKKLFPTSPILFDDVWFWGHFTINRDNLDEINESMLYCDTYIDDKFISKHNLRDKLNGFIEIVKNFRK
jgi:hypothetical protein